MIKSTALTFLFFLTITTSAYSAAKVDKDCNNSLKATKTERVDVKAKSKLPALSCHKKKPETASKSGTWSVKPWKWTGGSK